MSRSDPADPVGKKSNILTKQPILKPSFLGLAKITSVELTIPGVVIPGCVVMFLFSLISSVSFSEFAVHSRTSPSPSQWKLTQVSRYDAGGFVIAE